MNLLLRFTFLYRCFMLRSVEKNKKYLNVIAIPWTQFIFLFAFLLFSRCTIRYYYAELYTKQKYAFIILVIDNCFMIITWVYELFVAILEFWIPRKLRRLSYPLIEKIITCVHRCLSITENYITGINAIVNLLVIIPAW